MKLSAGTIGTLLFTAIATTAFVYMAKRPAVDTTAMSLGMPSQVTSTTTPTTEPEITEEKVEAVEEKLETTIEEPAKEEQMETEKAPEADTSPTTTN